MFKDTLFPAKITIRLNDALLDLSRPIVMGILNITPDSFFAGSRVFSPQQVVDRAAEMLQQGATILDMGAMSTRPGADAISLAEETDRLIPAIEAVHKAFPNAFLSADTYRASLAKAAVQAGASIINDVSGGSLDEHMFSTVASLNVPYILMHMRGKPANMQQNTQYDNLVANLMQELLNKANTLHRMGVSDIILDPGFGFAKTIEQNFTLLHQLHDLATLGYPVLAGLSRKSMIYKSLNCTADDALNGTTVLNTIALSRGARILRVHDVKPAVEAIQLWEKTVYA